MCIRDSDTTVLLSTHVLPEIEALCDRVIILNQGRIVAQDTVAALGSSEHRIRIEVERPSEALASSLQALAGVHEVKALGDGAYLLRTEGDQRAVIAQCAVEAGLLHLGTDRRLEDVFLRLTGGMA